MNVDYKKFYEYFIELYGTGLEVLYWNLNGESEPLDSFIDAAAEYMNTNCKQKEEM